MRSGETFGTPGAGRSSFEAFPAWGSFAMALSDRLTDLAGRTKRLEDTAAAARAKNVAKMEEQREQLRTNAAQAKGEAQAWWTETTAKIEQQRTELQTKREQRQSERAVEAQKRYADAADEFASSLTALAAYAVDAAAEATVDATIAREQAETAAKAPVAN